MAHTSPQPAGEAPAALPADNFGHVPLPTSYSNDQLVLMARDPGWVHSYWDISPERMSRAARFLGGRDHILLRLRDRQSGRLVEEREINTVNGQTRMALPYADHVYVAELALVHDGREILLASSGVMKSPPDQPRRRVPMVMVGRSQQQEALRLGRPILSSGSGSIQAPPRLMPPSQLPKYSQLQLASEARLMGLSSFLRLYHPGSEGRLIRQVHFSSLRAVTRVAAVQPRFVSTVIQFLKLFMGDEGSHKGHVAEYQVRSADSPGTPGNPVYLGNLNGWQANTYYVPYDSYGSYVVATDQSAPGRGVPGSYMYYDGHGWIAVEVAGDGGVGQTDSPDAGSEPSTNSQPSAPKAPNLGPDPFDVTGQPPTIPGQQKSQIHLFDIDNPVQISPDLLELLDQDFSNSLDATGVDGGTGSYDGGFGGDEAGFFGSEIGIGGGYGDGANDGGGEYGESGYSESGYSESGYSESGYSESGYSESGYSESGYSESGYSEGSYSSGASEGGGYSSGGASEGGGYSSGGASGESGGESSGGGE